MSRPSVLPAIEEAVTHHDLRQQKKQYRHPDDQKECPQSYPGRVSFFRVRPIWFRCHPIRLSATWARGSSDVTGILVLVNPHCNHQVPE
jgi:hypothetical protein